MRGRRRLIIVVALAALLLLLGRGLAAVVLDYQWYAALGAGAVWRARAGLTALTGLVTFAAGSIFAFLNLYAVRGSVVSLVLPRRVANLEIGEEVPPRYLLAGTIVLALLLGVALIQLDWIPAAKFVYADPFGEADPYFQRDLGFFAYWLPLERALYWWALLATLLVAAVVVFLYALTPSLRWERGTLRVSQYVRRHLTVLAAVLLAMLAWSYRLDAFTLLGDGSGALGEFSYVDHRVLIPANLLLSIMTLAGALALLWTGWAGQLRAAFATVSALLLLSLLLHQLAPALSRRLAGQQDPAVRERPYLATRAAYTRRAFALEQLSAPHDSGWIASDAARATPSWDLVALRRSIERTRGADLARAFGMRTLPDGELAALAVTRGSESTAADWGAQYFSLSRADERGGPVMVDQRGAPTSEWLALAPVVVVDSGDGYAIVADSGRRVAGVPLAEGTGRLVPAWALQNFRLLTQDLPHPAPRLVVHRNVRDVVDAVAPLFEQSDEITPALAADTLLWMVDLYTTAPDYPLSARVEVDGAEYAYLHHAATAIVNGTTARVQIVADTMALETDPLLRAWRRRFPERFVAIPALDPQVAAQLPVHTDAALAQRAAFATAGTVSEGAVQRRVPLNDGADSALAGDHVGRFASGSAVVLSLPVLRADEHLDGVVVARGGPAAGTRWIADSAGPHWTVVLDRLRGADSASVSRENRLAHGPATVVPVVGGTVVAQASYLIRAQSAPALEAISVLRGDSLRTGATVFAAMGVSQPAPPIGAPPIDLRASAAALYDSLRADQRRGDWRSFGDHWDALGRLLGRPPR
ncbi:MAG TPA: UPF0182 family protein [Gemmatimonadaceae bacterium]